MTSRRVLTLLVAGLAVIALGVWLSSKRHLERATLAGDLVLPGLESTLNNVTEVRLIKGDSTRTTLKKGESGWIVGERDYPADSGKVRKLLLDFGALNVVEEKTRVSANYPALGVEDVNSPKATGTRVEIVTPAKTYAVIVGKSSSAKSGYVRVANSEQSLLAAPLISVDADPKRWLDHTLVDVPQERVKEVDAKPADGPAYTASREKKDQPDFTVSPIPKGRELSNPTVADPIAGSLVSLTLDDVRKAGDAKPTADTSSGTDAKAASGADGKTTGTDSKPVGADGKSAGADSKSTATDSKAGSNTNASTGAGKPGAKAASAYSKADDANASEGKVSRAIFRTFDGLELDVAGRKDGTQPLVSISARSTAKETEDEAQKLNARLQGWEFEIPAYKYDAIFKPLDDLLAKPPEPAKKADAAKKEKAGKADQGSAAKSGKAEKTSKADKQ